MMTSRREACHWSRRVLPLCISICILAAAGLTGCSYLPGLRVNSPTPYDETNRTSTDRSPGTLLDATTVGDIDPAIKRLGATAVKVLYRSTSGMDGSPTEVSGIVFIPSGKPPVGGWPVVAYAHGATGMSQECGPSLSPNLRGSAGVVAGYIQFGFAVTVADYQGLGAPGVHPYLDSKTAAFNIIDSVRALRAVSKNVSLRWAVLGGSEGGAAAWAANEVAATYGKGLDLVGAVALAPMANMTGIAEAAANGTLSPDQMGVYIYTLMGLEETRPGFPIDEYRHGVAQTKWQELHGCLGDESKERTKALFELTAEDLVPASPEAVKRLSDIFQDMALPHARGSAPMLVVYGGKDSFVPFEWTRDAVARACGLGTRIVSVFQADRGHADLRVDEFAGWLLSRMDGLPAPDNC